MDQCLMKLCVKLQAVHGSAQEQDENGATAVEYALLVAMVAAIIPGVVGLLGLEVQAAFDTMLGAMP